MIDPLLLSVIIAILTFLLQSPENAKERRQALLGSALAGLGTYYVATETEWGQSLFGNGGTTGGGTVPITGGNGTTTTGPGPGGAGSGTGSTGGATDWIKANIVPLLTGAAFGVAGGAGSPLFFLIIIGAFLLLRS